MSIVGGFLEHTAIELQPRELTIDEALRTCQKIDVRRNGPQEIGPSFRRWFFVPCNGLGSFSHN